MNKSIRFYEETEGKYVEFYDHGNGVDLIMGEVGNEMGEQTVSLSYRDFYSLVTNLNDFSDYFVETDSQEDGESSEKDE
jgi:hypothetical protein